MAKVLDLVYGPTTVGSLATVDSGALPTAGADGVQVVVVVSGAASGQVNFYHTDAQGVQTPLQSATGLAVGNYLYTLTPGGSNTAPSVSAFPGPQTGFKAVAGSGGAITLSVYKVTVRNSLSGA